MNLDTAPEKAAKVTGQKTAARLYHAISWELEAGASGSEELYEKGEQALAVLEQRFPNIRRQAGEITDPPPLSQRAKRELDNRDGDSPKPRQGLPPRRTGRRRSASRGGGRRAGGLFSRRIDQTGIPGAYESTAQMVMRTLGGIASLAFMYALLQPNGARAINLGGSTVARAIGALVDPNVDPLRSLSPTSTPTSAKPTSTRTLVRAPAAKPPASAAPRAPTTVLA